MAILLNAHQLEKSFGASSLFSHISFGIESGDRIGLIGPNGAGKSTLLRILALEEGLDSGKLAFQKGLKVGFMKQVPEFEPDATILSSAMEGLVAENHDWEGVSDTEEILSRLGLTSMYSSDTLVKNLSGGWRKKVALARELSRKPDLLLLDEPTNHLDLESILWLEEFIAQAPFATLTITHDREFLQKVSNRILDLDRRLPNGLLDVRGNYSNYIESKTQLLESQKQRETTLRNTLRREVEWLNRGAKARTTKQQARIQRAEDLKVQVSDLKARNYNPSVQLEFQKAEKNPKKLIEVKQISKSYGDKTLFRDFNLILTKNSRIGILGKNGSGKSTLIRIMLGQEPPDNGDVTLADQLKVAYFEQNRELLQPRQTLIKTLCPTGDHVIFQGRSIHIRSYLDRFLFDPAQGDMPIERLSGGEQSRVLLAKLMLEEANLLVLDEPTNDLDFQTLDVLETCLDEFDGAVILVSHDRYFLDQVADQIIAFPSETQNTKKLHSFANLSQWETWHKSEVQIDAKEVKPKSEGLLQTSLPQKKKKLSFKDQLELDNMENTIAQAESELNKCIQESSNSADVSPKRMMEISQALAAAQEKVDKLYKRWEELLT